MPCTLQHPPVPHLAPQAEEIGWDCVNPPDPREPLNPVNQLVDFPNEIPPRLGGISGRTGGSIMLDLIPHPASLLLPTSNLGYTDFHSGGDLPSPGESSDGGESSSASQGGTQVETATVPVGVAGGEVGVADAVTMLIIAPRTIGRMRVITM